MKIEPAPFSMLWQHPRKGAKGDCQWCLLDHTRKSSTPSHDPLESPALIRGTCPTYKEARGLLIRIGKACQRAYRYGYLAGYKAGRTYRKPLRLIDANAGGEVRRDAVTSTAWFASGFSEMKNTLTVSWFSAGVSSAVATWLVRDQLDKIIYTHIDDQHPDTMRFVKDCEAWFGKPVEILQSPYRTVAAAWKASGWRMAHNPSGHAPCTNFLKRRVRREWECGNQWFNTFRYVWGMDCDEAARCERLRETMREVEHLFPLVEKGITKEEAHGILKRAGVKRPAMYDLGYRNNNCVGCVKGGKGYWNRIRVDFPQVFAERAAMERLIGGTCINGTWLDELDPSAGRDDGPVVEECGAMCELVMQPACVPVEGSEK